MVASRRRRGQATHERARFPNARRARPYARRAASRRGSARLGLGVGECGRRQDQGAHRPGGAPPPLRRAARADPVPDLHEGGRRQHGDPRLRAPRPLGHARRGQPARRSSRTSKGVRPSREQIRLARRLFARAVETPGGLKIDTIHAFCERLLHLVPFEANVPARFAVLDESQADELVAQATANVLAGRRSTARRRTSPRARPWSAAKPAGGRARPRSWRRGRLRTAFASEPAARGRPRRACAWRSGLGRRTPRSRRSSARCWRTGRRASAGSRSPRDLDAGKTTDQKRAASLRGLARRPSDADERARALPRGLLHRGRTAARREPARHQGRRAPT